MKQWINESGHRFMDSAGIVTGVLIGETFRDEPPSVLHAFCVAGTLFVIGLIAAALTGDRGTGGAGC